MPAPRVSAGLLLYRQTGNTLEVLLVHPSGSYNRHKPWSIPKGIPDPDETPEEAARRETWEETGLHYLLPLTDLGTVRYQKSGKTIYAFSGPAPAAEEPRCASWEVDQARFVPLSEAYKLLHPDQCVFLSRLEALLKSATLDGNHAIQD